MSLRIPLTNDQTLQVEFHEIERRLRRLEKATGTSGQNTRIVVSGGGGGVNLQPVYERLTALEQAVAGISGISLEDIPDFGAVGPDAQRGLVLDPGTAVPPDGVAQHVLTEDNGWGFPLRGLIGVSTSGEQTDPPYDVVNIHAGLQVGHVTAADVVAVSLEGDIDGGAP